MDPVFIEFLKFNIKNLKIAYAVNKLIREWHTFIYLLGIYLNLVVQSFKGFTSKKLVFKSVQLLIVFRTR